MNPIFMRSSKKKRIFSRAIATKAGTVTLVMGLALFSSICQVFAVENFSLTPAETNQLLQKLRWTGDYAKSELTIRKRRKDSVIRQVTITPLPNNRAYVDVDIQCGFRKNKNNQRRYLKEVRVYSFDTLVGKEIFYGRNARRELFSRILISNIIPAEPVMKALSRSQDAMLAKFEVEATCELYSERARLFRNRNRAFPKVDISTELSLANVQGEFRGNRAMAGPSAGSKGLPARKPAPAPIPEPARSQEIQPKPKVASTVAGSKVPRVMQPNAVAPSGQKPLLSATVPYVAAPLAAKATAAQTAEPSPPKPKYAPLHQSQAAIPKPSRAHRSRSGIAVASSAAKPEAQRVLKPKAVAAPDPKPAVSKHRIETVSPLAKAKGPQATERPAPAPRTPAPETEKTVPVVFKVVDIKLSIEPVDVSRCPGRFLLRSDFTTTTKGTFSFRLRNDQGKRKEYSLRADRKMESGLWRARYERLLILPRAADTMYMVELTDRQINSEWVALKPYCGS